MRVTVKLFADLHGHAPDGSGGSFPLELPEGVTVGEALDRLGIPAGKPKILLVNGLHADRSRVLAEGATLAVFPPVAGG